MNKFRNTAADKIRKWLDTKSQGINHNSIIKDIATEADISTGYFATLVAANLIALCGLLTNSVAVIIGAMLISPLMGPIINFGYAFVTGNDRIWRLSVRKIALSVSVTIIIAALAVLISPLKDATPEILARTKPNLYDLIIAFLAGTVGATAQCTKKSYLTIVPGVAIATAVIPPLGVAGYGLALSEWRVMLGGFFLFFTNFVAIILSTGIVFYVYGFRPTAIQEDRPSLRRRMTYLLGLLAVISIPLVYTLQSSIAELRLSNTIRDTLRQAFDVKGRSSLQHFTFTRTTYGVDVSATVNTVELIPERAVQLAGISLSQRLGQEAQIHVDQVQVLTEATDIRPVIATAIQAAPTSTPPAHPSDPAELAVQARRQTLGLASKAVADFASSIAPSRLLGWSIGYAPDQDGPILELRLALASTLPAETLTTWERLLITMLPVKTTVRLRTEPLFTVQVLGRRAGQLPEEFLTQAATAARMIADGNAALIVVESAPERLTRTRLDITLAEKRAAATVAILTAAGVPAEALVTRIVEPRPDDLPALRLSALAANATHQLPE